MASRAQLSMFGAPEVRPRDTYGVKYAGSKGRLLPYILAEVSRTNARRVLDGFAGTTRVSQAVAQSGRLVTASDRSVLSKTFGQCFLRFPTHHFGLIAEQLRSLNSLRGVDGWFSQNYGGFDRDGRSVGNDGLKKPWMMHNTQRLDAIRSAIDEISVDEDNKSVLLCSLILALDKVDNTLGHHVSYLGAWAARASGSLKLEMPIPSGDFSAGHRVHHEDIFDTLRREVFDLCYFDPPYGSNNEKMPPSRVRYESYYHLWKTIILNDRPMLFGKACRREDSRDEVHPSLFESYKMDGHGRYVATNQIKALIDNAQAPRVLLSYSSGGRATMNCLLEAISSSGRLRKVIEIDYKRNVMADMVWTGKWTRDINEPNQEYLFVIDK